MPVAKAFFFKVKKRELVNETMECFPRIHICKNTLVLTLYILETLYKYLF